MYGVRHLEREWQPLFELTPLADAEVLSSTVPLADKLVNWGHAFATAIETRWLLVGAGLGGATDCTLNFYRSPIEGEQEGRPLAGKHPSSITFATQAFDLGAGASAEGSDLITTGDFASATGWQAGTQGLGISGWTITGGAAFIGTNLTKPDTLSQVLAGGALTEGTLYLLTFTVVATSGALSVRLEPTAGGPGGQLLENYVLPGGAVTKAILFRPQAAGLKVLVFSGTSSGIAIDNVTLKAQPAPFRYADMRRADTVGSGIRFGVLPAADLSSTTFLSAWFRRYTGVF